MNLSMDRFNVASVLHGAQQGVSCFEKIDRTNFFYIALLSGWCCKSLKKH